MNGKDISTNRCIFINKESGSARNTPPAGMPQRQLQNRIMPGGRGMFLNMQSRKPDVMDSPNLPGKRKRRKTTAFYSALQADRARILFPA
ncbi:hypothetical protein T10_3913 [Trichinella papuae]|uniref:Uncharacterized protein n=1 Tax=Trichinella papuae TaxID=268474 RepID=A0A0V1M321_9BILA|nr:hypothetical protein T10_2681 [Trichinella papuae]KRZ66000.1 hypothetical protein T10_3913 [Trichinella papuae]